MDRILNICYNNIIYVVLLCILIPLSFIQLATYYFKPIEAKHFYAINKEIPQIPLIDEVYTFSYETDKVIVGQTSKGNLRSFSKNRWHFIWIKQ